ncbi:hypothetical protein HNR06_003334 [Nocardiopsis arvandica]|uniref:Uncharacterized protein n=1 Tax=Nocardiopsis sinuspersici TaxID=501010 RepID=A0A7Z0BL26_9ACTN|nr:hypothetical protein [Nocardiopsis sinuspersici]NYH53745.1 hypothetical protein [Nocardiopsis sinuspersici]
MTHPPNDGSFPGPPGGQPFPGRPGPPQPGPPQSEQPHPGQWPGPHGGPGPRQGRPQVPPALPGHGVPGWTPPRQPPVPGPPGGPGTGGRRRTGLVVGGAAAALLLLASVGVVAWSLADGRPYAGLPTCRELLPSDMLDRVPGAGRLTADGDYTPADEFQYGELGEGALGILLCTVSDSAASESGRTPMWVSVTLYEYDDGGEAAEVMVGEYEERREEVETGDEDSGVALVDWRPVSAGDGGVAALYESGEDDSGAAGYASAFFPTVNTMVAIDYVLNEGSDGEEALGFLDDFAPQVERQLSREGERA